MQSAGRPLKPSDLSDLNYVMHNNIRANGALTLVSEDGIVEEVPISPVLRSDNSHMICEAVAAGVGVGLIHDVLLTPMIETGQLERVLPGWHYETQHVHAIYPSNRYIPKRIRVFVDELSSYLRKL
ncbi:hypothetical protein I3J13_25465 [Agrobacterium sp. MOPV5]|nr:LysR substrate-binding domain-containing protein [Agrobacterium leguminum]MBG0512130.1 hypothetical protein [Agrobacterium leguminum]